MQTVKQGTGFHLTGKNMGKRVSASYAKGKGKDA